MENNYRKSDVELITNTFIKVISEKLQKDTQVKIDGLGTFSTYYRNVSQNYKSKDSRERLYNVRCIRFSPSKKLK